MWRFTAAGVLVALLGVAALSMQATPVHACSAGPDFDPVLESDVIVEGRFLGWEFAPEADHAPTFPAVWVNMAVEKVWKGAVPTDVITLLDRNTVQRLPEDKDVSWIGSSGACGAFNFDPTGRYGIMGLTRLEDGTYAPNLLKVFFIGDGPDSKGEQARPATYQEAIDRLRGHPAAASLPTLGTGPAPSTVTNHLVAAVVALGIALLAAGGTLRYRSRRTT